MERMKPGEMASYLLAHCPEELDADVLQVMHEADQPVPPAWPGHVVIALHFGAGGVKIHTAPNLTSAWAMWRLAQDCLNPVGSPDISWLDCMMVVSAEQWERCRAAIGLA